MGVSLARGSFGEGEQAWVPRSAKGLSGALWERVQGN